MLRLSQLTCTVPQIISIMIIMINDNANDNAKNNANNTNDNSSSGSSSGSSTGRCGSGTRDETIEMKVCLVQIIRYLNHILFI